MKQKFLSIVLATMTVMPAVAQSTENAVQPQKTWYGQELYLQNISYGSANPSSIAKNPYTQLNSIQGSYSNISGKFRPVDGADKQTLTDFSIYGTKKVKKVSFEGSLDYRIENENNSRWNNSVLRTEKNPFIIADSLYYLGADGTDSIPNDHNREIFNLNGGFSYQATDRLVLALRANYKVGSLADQSDPRFEAHGARIRLNPGAEFRLNDKLSFGLSGTAEMYHENISCTVEDNIYPTHTIFFLFQQIGNYTVREGSSYARRYNGKTFGGSADAEFSTGVIQNFLEAGATVNIEEAIDGGSSYEDHAGEYHQTDMAFKDRFQVKGDNMIHNVELNAGILMSKGKVFKQNTHKDNLGNTIWEISSSEITQKEQDVVADLSYRLDLVKNGFSHFTAKVNGGIDMVSVTQYPDDYHAKYTLANAGLEVSKRWKENQVRYSVTALGNYTMALNELDLVVPMTKSSEKKFANSYYSPKYQYEAAEFFNASLKADAAYSIVGRDQNRYWIKLGASYNLRKYLGDYNRFNDRQTVMANISLTF